MINRYDLIGEEIGNWSDGDYVKFSDYEKLEDENRHLKAKLAEAEKENEELRRDAGRLEFSVEKTGRIYIRKDSSTGLWNAMDASNGLAFIGRGYSSMREALDAAMPKKTGEPE